MSKCSSPRRVTRLAIALSCAGAVVSTVAAAPPARLSDTANLEQALNARMGLLDSEVVTLPANLPAGVPHTLTVPMGSETYTLELALHSIRAEGYALYEVGADGVQREIPAGPINTYRGYAVESAGSRVVASIVEGGLHATVDLADGQRFWIEPIARRVDEPAPGIHVVYRNEDVIPTEGICGTSNDKFAAEQWGDPDAHPEGAAAGGEVLCVAELACDTDFEYFQDWGGSTEGRINSVINSVNNQYENQTGITHEITAIIVRSSSNDPYTTNNAGALLDQFRSEWLANQGSIQRDVAHLFTGKNLSGGTIGIAYTIGGICSTSAYCLAESDCCGSFACATDLTAHELGHLWGGFHCDPCNTTMRSFIGCFNNFIAGTISSIVNHRDSSSCLDCATIAYCGATATQAGPEFISNVQLENINNSSGLSAYSDFSGQFAVLEKGEPHTLTVTVSGADAATIGGAWIDWNQDLEFDIVTEVVTLDWSGTGPYTFNIDMPANAALGNTRLRMRVQDSGGSPGLSPCNTSTRGEVEDYGITVVNDQPAPVNDRCVSALDVFDGDNLISNFQATTDGPDEVLACDFGSTTQIGSDVWFSYTAPCTGTVGIDLCSANFDSKMAVYTSCPTLPSQTVIACDDDACAPGSFLFVGMTEGTEYLIRVGGADAAQGAATLSIFNLNCPPDAGACCAPDGSCSETSEALCDADGGTFQGAGTDCGGVSCAPPCVEDVDGDMMVGFSDLLAVLGAWGPCPACPEDIDGDSMVGFSDLLAVLGAWGPC